MLMRAGALGFALAFQARSSRNLEQFFNSTGLRIGPTGGALIEFVRTPPLGRARKFVMCRARDLAGSGHFGLKTNNSMGAAPGRKEIDVLMSLRSMEDTQYGRARGQSAPRLIDFLSPKPDQIAPARPTSEPVR